MKTKRLATGHYELTATTTLDGVQVPVRYSIWKHEMIQCCWMVEVEINGRSTGCYGDHGSKATAVYVANKCAETGYQTVPGLGICSL